MGRWTALVVAGVIGLAAVGLGDAIRGGGDGDRTRQAEPESSVDEPTTAGEPRTVSERLASREIRGLLYATIRQGTICRVEVIALPTLSSSFLAQPRSCRIRVSPTGLVAGGGPCGDPAERISSQTQVGIRTLRGCAPDWRPDGGLTFVNPGGDVVEYVEPCSSVKPCLRVAVPRDRIPKQPRDLAWLDEDRLAILVGGRFRLDRSLAIFEDGRLVSHPGPCCPVREYLRAVGGSLLVPSDDRAGAVLAFDRNGRLTARLALPPYLADGLAFTASGDGRWIASTLGDTVQIYSLAEDRPLDPIQLDVRAVDLGWVGSS
jgi:hypothetical protein